MRLVRQGHTTGKESETSQARAKRHNPARTLTWKYKHVQHTVIISAGSDDQVYAFRTTVPRGASNTTPEIYVLSYNSRLGYVGLQKYTAEALRAQYTEEEGAIFLEGWNAEQALGQGWDDLSVSTLVLKLIERLPY